MGKLTAGYTLYYNKEGTRSNHADGQKRSAPISGAWKT